MTSGKKSHYSGELKYHQGILSYKFHADEWNLPVSGIRLIGEHTTSDGPFIDDYFLSFFVSKGIEGWYQASFYAEGRDEALAAMSEELNAPLSLELCNSAQFKSRVIWPINLTNSVLFELAPPVSKMESFRQKWLGAPVEMILSDSAKTAFTE